MSDLDKTTEEMTSETSDVSCAPEKKNLTISAILLIQAAVIIYTFSAICGKMAGSHTGSAQLFGITIPGFTLTGFLWIFGEIACLGFYAIFWQQIIKRFDLSIAYANRAFAIFWTFLWSILFFHEQVRPANIIGILIVFLGIQLVNKDAR